MCMIKFKEGYILALKIKSNYQSQIFLDVFFSICLQVIVLQVYKKHKSDVL